MNPILKAVFVLAGLALPPAGAAVADPLANTQSQLAGLLAQARAHPPDSDPGVHARVASVSAALLGRPYRRDPLGEGADASIDSDPLLTFEAFDCVTYVETVLALARAHGPAQARTNLLALRYGGQAPSFVARTHLPSLDWLPNALAQHAIEESTGMLFPDLRLSALTVTLDREDALRRLARGQGSGSAARAAPSMQEGWMQHVSLRYLGTRELLGASRKSGAAARRARLARIPSGTVVLVVGRGGRALRESGIAEAIYHFGFAVRGADGDLVFRSASADGRGRVRDVSFERYLQRGRSSGRMQGLVLLRPLPA